MAKRELIDKTHLLTEIKKLQKSPWYNCGKNDMTILGALYNERKEAVEVVRDLCINDEPVITEQEIVKFYLEKLKAGVEYLRLHKGEFITSDCKVCVDSQKVIELIDNLLTE